VDAANRARATTLPLMASIKVTPGLSLLVDVTPGGLWGTTVTARRRHCESTRRHTLRARTHTRRRAVRAYLCVLCVRACVVLCPPVTVCVEWSRWNGRASANLFAEGEQTRRLNRLRRPQLNNQQHHTPHTHTDRRGGRYTTQWQRNRRGCSCSVLKEQFSFYSFACFQWLTHS
jgi:hypothetical protein